MKIVHLSSVHSPCDTRIFLKECKTVASFGYKVVFIVPNDHGRQEDNITIRNVPKRKGRLKRIMLTLFDIYQAAKQENGDIYHFHDPELILVGFLLKLQGKKIVYDAHEDVPRQIMTKPWIIKPFRKIMSWVFEKIENFAAKRFSALITATPYIRDRFMKIGCNAIDVNNYPILSELYEDNVQWTEKEQAVCYVGGVWPERGLFEMIDAIEKTSAKLIMAGNIFHVDQKKLHFKNGWDRVEYLGHVDRAQVANVMKRARAGLVLFHARTNHINAQPNKLFEYMSAGIPVIASDFPLWRKIIHGASCGIVVNPLDVQAIAEAINWLLNNPAQAEVMGKCGREAVCKNYNWQFEGEKLINLYNKIID